MGKTNSEKKTKIEKEQAAKSQNENGVIVVIKKKYFCKFEKKTFLPV